MILRRLSQSIKEQNWIAIVIEFILLVSGVFLGIQVANWNDDRVTAKRAAIFTERLRSDLREEAWGYEVQIGYYSDVADNAKRALDALAGRAPLSDEQLLIAAYRATQFNANTRRRATYDELTSRGEIGLVGDGKLRDLAQRVFSDPLFDQIVDEGRASPYRQWFRLNQPHEVQQALADTCGDRVVRVGDYAGIDSTLDYPCATGLSTEAVTTAVAILRTDPEALRLLRLRHADVQTGLYNLITYSAPMRNGLRNIAGNAP